MLEERSSATTMSRPRDEMVDCAYGSTGSMSAQPIRISAATRTAVGSPRRIDARYFGADSQRTVVDAAKVRRTRQRTTPTATRAATIHHARSRRRKRIRLKVRLKPDTTEVRLKLDTTEARLKPDTTEARLKPDTTEARLKPDTTEVRLKPDTHTTKARSPARPVRSPRGRHPPTATRAEGRSERARTW